MGIPRVLLHREKIVSLRAAAWFLSLPQASKGSFHPTKTTKTTMRVWKRARRLGCPKKIKKISPTVLRLYMSVVYGCSFMKVLLI